jgi:hypothetical protein
VHPVEVRSQFAIASLTKTVLAAEVMRLSEHPARLVLIYHVLANSLGYGPPQFAFYDGQELVRASEDDVEVAPGGDYVERYAAGPAASAGRVAHLLACPPFYAAPIWKFDLPVQRSTCLSTGAPFRLGRWQVSITKLEVTPSTLHVRAFVAGATSDSFSDPLLTAVDQNGTTLRWVGGGDEIAEGGWLFDYQFMRPVEAGSYRLQFKANGATHTVTVGVPASDAI